MGNVWDSFTSPRMCILWILSFFIHMGISVLTAEGVIIKVA